MSSAKMKIILGLAACKANTTRKEANKSIRFMDEADHPVSINEAQAKEFALFQKGFGVATALHLLGIDQENLPSTTTASVMLIA
jgi:hypothetical protein